MTENKTRSRGRTISVALAIMALTALMVGLAQLGWGDETTATTDATTTAETSTDTSTAPVAADECASSEVAESAATTEASYTTGEDVQVQVDASNASNHMCGIIDRVDMVITDSSGKPIVGSRQEAFCPEPCLDWAPGTPQRRTLRWNQKAWMNSIDRTEQVPPGTYFANVTIYSKGRAYGTASTPVHVK